MTDHFQEQLEKVKSSMSDPTKTIEEPEMATKAKKTTTKKPATEKKAKPAKNDNLVSLKTVAAEFKLDARAARKKLRSGGLKADGRWAWEKDSKDLSKVREILSAKAE